VEASGDALSDWLRGAGAAANSDRDIPELRAELQLEPDALRVLNAELNEGEKTYTVDAHLQGLQALAHFDPQRCAKPRALPDMPGIAGLQEWLEDQPDDATRQSSPTKSLELQLDVLAHPALFCTLEDFRAKLHWSATDLDLELEHAQFGGLTIAANLARSEQAAPGSGSHWRLEARLLAPLASPHLTDAPPTALPAGSWARGRITLSAMSLGALDVQGASAQLEARRSSLRLSELALHFEEQHAIHGHFQLALGEAVPRFRSDLRVTSVPADALATAFGAKETLVEGETNADLELRGSLDAWQDLISNASGHLDFKISSGSLRARLPFLLALSAASPTSNPFRDRDRLNFETFDLAGSIADGQLELEKFKLDGPAISAISSGHVSLVDPYPADLELALFFLQRTSSLLQRVPVVGNLLLGDNGSLMGAVFAVDGSLSSPQVRLVPGRTFAESLPGALLRGIPTQLLEGARRVTSLAGSVTRDRATP